MKKLLSIILMASMIVTLTPIAGGGVLTQSVAYAEDGTDYEDATSGLNYKLYTDGTNNTATITGYTGTATELTIPSTVENENKTYTVTSIDNYVFSYSSKIKKITIPGSIRNMSCPNLKSVTIPAP